MLAETVSFTEEEILAILLVLLGILAAVVATVALGCVWAWRAGRGSQLALAGFVGVVTLEAFCALAALPGILDGSLFVVAPVGAITVQVALYVIGRDRDGAEP